MVTNKIKNILKHYPISEEKEKRLFDKGFLTGSRLFGGFAEDSDYDLLFHNPKDWDFHNDGFGYDGKLAYIPNEYRTKEFTSWYFRTKDNKYLNIIDFYEKEDYFVWCKSTEILFNMIKNSVFIKNGMNDKEIRVNMFETIKSCVRKE
jgi:predicted nucleotidyltransferase